MSDRGPRPDDFKTSVRVHGIQQCDEFLALCALLGRRPHELAADFVLDGIRAARTGRLAEPVAQMVQEARLYQGRDTKTGESKPGERIPDNVVQLDRRRR